MPRPTSPALDGGRLRWADTAKALSILLVVLHHTVSKHVGFVFADPLTGAANAWHELTFALRPVRMPLFFVVSGLFAGTALTRPWRDVMRPRVLNIYYLYALWLCIHMAVFMVLVELPMNRSRDWTELVTNLLVPSTGLWYLYALVAYFLLARVLGRLDPRVVVGLAAGLALVTPALGIEAVNTVALLQHFVYFVFAAHFPAVVGAMARLRLRPALLLAAAAVGVALLPAALGTGWHASRFVVSLLAVPVAVRASAALAQWPPAAALASVIGRRTLAIYVLHVPVLAVLHILLVGSVQPGGTGIAALTAMTLYPLVVTCLVVLVCLGFHHVANRSGFAWLFTSPFDRRRPATIPPGTVTPAAVRDKSTAALSSHTSS